MGIRPDVNTVLRAVVVFLRLPHTEQRALLRLFAVSAVIEVMLRTRPLPCVADLVGVAFAEDTAVAVPMAPLVLTERERRELRCVRRIVRHWRFCEGTCLRESLLAGHVLRRRRPRLVIGVNRHEGAFTAHAWLDVQGRIIGDPDVFQRLG
jgi:hypothetical protein